MAGGVPNAGPETLTVEVRLAIQGGPYRSPERWERRWLECCRDRDIPHALVDCYDSGVIDRLKEFDGLLWHFHFERATDLFMARHVLQAAEEMGVAVFPNSATCWHYDDKVAQKYLLESLKAPLVPTYVFYEKAKALAWLKQASYPLVWKLRGGAGSSNVRLVKNYAAARRLSGRAFGRGTSPVPGYFRDTATKVRKARSWAGLWGKVQRMPSRIQEQWRLAREAQREKGYVLFQEFIPDNSCDTRVAVVGERAWGFTRRVRKNDFRASGSGSIDYDPDRVNPECVQIAFRLAQALGAQSMAFDFLAHPERGPQIVEVSYGYLGHAVHRAPGYWEPDLTWREGHYWPQDAVLDDLLAGIERRRE